MHFIALNCSFVTSLRLLEIFIAHVFVTTQSICIGASFVELDGSVEEFDRYFMLFLQ